MAVFICPGESLGDFRVGIEEVVEFFEFIEKSLYNLNRICKIRFPSWAQTYTILYL